MTNILNIVWAMPEPPVAPRAWQRVAPADAAEAADAALEGALGWPAGTIAALRYGFEKHLPRSTGWEGDGADVATAARVFKRGVGHRTDGDAPEAKQLSGAYQVHVTHGDDPPPQVRGGDGVFTIVDGNVAAAWPRLSPAGARLTMTLDEHGKTLDAVAQILAAARDAGSPKAWTVIGGGLLSDVAAFAAGLAGAAITFVPTTLLAMADACVGGKTGVNFAPFGKNQVGSFHFPVAVHAWTGWLKSLPARELRAGGSECLKHAFLAGDSGLARHLTGALADNELEALGSVLPAVIEFKARIVAEDPGEVGRRAILNFGHTLGHALEGISQARTRGEETMLHGEAVGYGLVFALVLSRRVAGLTSDVAAKMIAMVREAGCAGRPGELQRGLGGLDLASSELMSELKRFVGHDKKSATSGPTSQWVLLDAPGEVHRESRTEWTTSVFQSEIAAAWPEFVRALR